MKIKFSLFIVCLLSLCMLLFAIPPAQAQSVSQGTITCPVNLVGSTASNINAVIDCRYQSIIPLEIRFQNDTAGTAANAWVFALSNTGNTNVNTKLISLSLAANGTSVAGYYTNIPTYGAQKCTLLYYTNASTGSINTTNVSFTYVISKGINY